MMRGTKRGTKERIPEGSGLSEFEDVSTTTMADRSSSSKDHRTRLTVHLACEAWPLEQCAFPHCSTLARRHAQPRLVGRQKSNKGYGPILESNVQ